MCICIWRVKDSLGGIIPWVLSMLENFYLSWITHLVLNNQLRSHPWGGLIFSFSAKEEDERPDALHLEMVLWDVSTLICELLSCLVIHIVEISWVSLACQIQKTRFHSRLLGPLTFTVFQSHEMFSSIRSIYITVRTQGPAVSVWVWELNLDPHIVMQSHCWVIFPGL